MGLDKRTGYVIRRGEGVVHSQIKGTMTFSPKMQCTINKIIFMHKNTCKQTFVMNSRDNDSLSHLSLHVPTHLYNSDTRWAHVLSSTMSNCSCPETGEKKKNKTKQQLIINFTRNETKFTHNFYAHKCKKKRGNSPSFCDYCVLPAFRSE